MSLAAGAKRSSSLEIPQAMAALRKAGAAPGLTFDRKTPVPGIGPAEVLVAVDYAGICGTDKHIYDWDPWSAARVPVGIVTGHEFVGRVVAIGAAVRSVSVGDRVSGEGHIGCGHCTLCRTGSAHICPSIDIIGVDRDGCFAEYVALPAENAWPTASFVPDRWAALMDPLGNAVHAVSEAQVSGRSVLVTGSGVIGLLAVAAARFLGASRVVATDVEDHRLELARRFGADATLRADDAGWVSEARRAAGGDGPEVLVEMSGHPDAVIGGLAALRNGGRAALLGLPARPVALDLAEAVIFKGTTLVGVNGREMFATWYEVERFLASSPPDLDALITHVLPLERYEEAFALGGRPEALKVLLEIGAP
ncbi:MAG: Alcohol dehydrogenase zinc-binding domain protein [Acidimicrobiaceae bacterium]|nr:Alcohol dehydrogenase zinc-binding domain protein [Acidimicrobiaceae bacterium]